MIWKISTPVTLKKKVIRYRYCNRYILFAMDSKAKQWHTQTWFTVTQTQIPFDQSLSFPLREKKNLCLFSKCISTFVSYCRSQAVLESSNAGLKRPGYIATWLLSPREHFSISRSHAASKVVQWTRSILLATCWPCSPSCYEKCKHKMANKTVVTFFRAGQEVCVVKSDKLLL